jgi:uncharacterized protein YodC (DUF2158 family)
MEINRDSFDASELVKLNDDEHVILASGGPLMRIVCTEGDNVLCEWADNEKRRQKLFPAGVLRRLMRLDFKQTTD